jgi:putative transposase
MHGISTGDTGRRDTFSRGATGQSYAIEMLICLGLVRYIHLNPVRAKVVRDPERYLWTSHQSYLGKSKEAVVDADFVLGQFGKNRSLGRRRYWEFILEGLESGHQQKFYEVKDQRFLGDENFVNRIDTERRNNENVVYEIPFEAIAKEVSKACRVDIERLYSLTYERQGVHGRGIAAYLARGLAGQMVKDIAEHFQKTPMRISQMIMEVENKLREDDSFRKLVERMKKNLIRQAKKKYFITIA